MTEMRLAFGRRVVGCPVGTVEQQGNESFRGLAGDDRKERLDQVQPRRRRRCEMQRDTGVARQPVAHCLVFVVA
jgi:hypothetical protein